MQSRSKQRSDGRAGFTLLEMIIAVTIMTVLVSAAVPLTTTVLSYKHRASTREELTAIADACQAYVRDTLELPTRVLDLIEDDGRAGWSGPYLLNAADDPVARKNAYLVDAWSRDYALRFNADVISLSSRGADAVGGSDDDITIEIDVTAVRREVTLERLKIVNQAIVLYNGAYQMTSPLPASYAAIYSQLTNRGLLPTGVDLQTDAWGDAFVEDPQGRTPVVRVRSVHVASR